MQAERGASGDDRETEAKVREAKAKLSFLEVWVRDNLGPLDVLPVSAKYNQNLRPIIKLLSLYVHESRTTRLYERPVGIQTV